MAAMTIVFCVSWDCVKPKNSIIVDKPLTLVNNTHEIRKLYMSCNSCHIYKHTAGAVTRCTFVVVTKLSTIAATKKAQS